MMTATFASAETHEQNSGQLIEAVELEIGADRELLAHPSLIHDRFLEKTRILSITYLSDGLPVTGFMVEPRAPGRYPAIIFNRGGYGEFGGLGIDLRLLRLADLAAGGYVVVASQYRGYRGAPGRDEFGGAEIADVLSLIDLLETRENVDASRIGMMGHSRGGMMTYLALARTLRIKAGVVIAGAADLQHAARARPAMGAVFASAIAVGPEEMPAELRIRSAVNWAQKLPKNVPLLLLHGTADWRVSPQESITMAGLLLEYEVPFRLILFEGSDHSLTEHAAEASRQVHEWFRRCLQDGAPLPALEPHGR